MESNGFPQLRLNFLNLADSHKIKWFTIKPHKFGNMFEIPNSTVELLGSDRSREGSRKGNLLVNFPNEFKTFGNPPGSKNSLFRATSGVY